MAAEREPIEIGDSPELTRLVDEVAKSGEPRVLRRKGKDVAVITPVAKQRRRSRVKAPKPTTADSPLWEIIGLAQKYEHLLDPNRPTDVSENKHKYLAEAYADLHKE
jgi:hypothetical protein